MTGALERAFGAHDYPRVRQLLPELEAAFPPPEGAGAVRLELTYLGTHWPWGGNLAYLTHPDGREARITVDDLGETWVDIRRVPDGGWFHTERVDAYRAINGADAAERELAEQGFRDRRPAMRSERVRERPL